jgi:outer membrane protein
MKKILLACVVLAACVISNTAKAQVKIGSFDEEGVLGLFPGLSEKLDSSLGALSDSLKEAYNTEIDEYKVKDSTFRADSSKWNNSKKTLVREEIAKHLYKIQNWQQLQQQIAQQRQYEILLPYKQRVYGALEEIMREQKYTHVLRADAFFAPAPLSDNLSIKVARRLKLQLPKDVEDAIKAQETQEGKPAGNKPATRPAGKG